MTAAAQQILDIGDAVQPADERTAEYVKRHAGDAPLTVFQAGIEPGAYWFITPNDDVLYGGPPGMERVGGPLQPGDWVRVTGTCKTIRGTALVPIEDEVGLIVDKYAEAGGPDFLVCVRGLADLYECRAPQLTRITRTEALA